MTNCSNRTLGDHVEKMFEEVSSQFTFAEREKQILEVLA